MALATTCPQCKTSFKVVPDQLKLRRGLVRCGSCQHVFSGIDHLRYVEEPRAGVPAAQATPDPLHTAFFLPETILASPPPDAGAMPMARGAQMPGQVPVTAPGQAPGQAPKQTAPGAAAAPGAQEVERSSQPAVPPPAAPQSTVSPPAASPPFGPAAPSLPSTPSASVASVPLSHDEEGERALRALEHAERSLELRGALKTSSGAAHIDTMDRAAPDARPEAAGEAKAPLSSGSAAGAANPPSPAGGAQPAASVAPATDASLSEREIDALALPRQSAADSSEEIESLLATTPRDFGDWPPESADTGAQDQAAGSVGSDDSLAATAATDAAPQSADTQPRPAPPENDETPAARTARAEASATAEARTAPPQDPLEPSPREPLHDATLHDAPLHGEPSRNESSVGEPLRDGPSHDQALDDQALDDQALHDQPSREQPSPEQPREPSPDQQRKPSHEQPHGTVGDSTGIAAPAPRRAATLPARDFPPPRRGAIPDSTADLDTDADLGADDESAIDYFSAGRRGIGFIDRHGPLTLLAAAVLTLLLIAQLMVAQRAMIAARWPALAPALATVVQPFGLALELPRDLQALTIESFELQAAAAPGELNLSALLRNRAAYPVHWPAMQLTLTDPANQVLVRKVLLPGDYLPPGAQPGVPPRGEWPLRVALDAQDLQPAGYSVKLFYQ